MSLLNIILSLATLALVFMIGHYFGYNDGYMTAVEERFEEENHNENY
jgi:hypothetical protein